MDICSKRFGLCCTFRKRVTLLLDLSETTLVDKLAYRLQVGLTVGHKRLDEAKHVDGSLVHLDKDAVVDLAQAQELQDLARLRGDPNDTADADNKNHLGLGLVVELSLLLGKATVTDLKILALLVSLYARLLKGVGLWFSKNGFFKMKDLRSLKS